MTTPDPAQVRRPLTDGELDTILTGITAAADTAALLHHTVTSTYQALLAGTGRTLADYDHTNQLDPRSFAIPTTQWHAIVEAATSRANQWGTGNHLAMELINSMPSSYQDPHVPTPQVEPVDYRPHVHELHVSREAVDVITACHQHITALADRFGWDSPYCLDAARTWLHLIGGLFGMSLGAHTRITRDGPLSLLVTTGGGLTYGIIFHPTTRRCTLPGCGATLSDNHTETTGHHPGVHDGPHVPSYPFDAPQPGQWSFHS